MLLAYRNIATPLRDALKCPILSGNSPYKIPSFKFLDLTLQSFRHFIYYQRLFFPFLTPLGKQRFTPPAQPLSLPNGCAVVVGRELPALRLFPGWWNSPPVRYATDGVYNQEDIQHGCYCTRITSARLQLEAAGGEQ